MWLEIMCLSNNTTAGTSDVHALYVAVAKSIYILSS